MLMQLPGTSCPPNLLPWDQATLALVSTLASSTDCAEDHGTLHVCILQHDAFLSTCCGTVNTDMLFSWQCCPCSCPLASKHNHVDCLQSPSLQRCSLASFAGTPHGCMPIPQALAVLRCPLVYVSLS